MLVLLPLITFVGVWVGTAEVWPALGGARSFLRASLLIGAWSVLVIELLSLINSITTWSLASAWAVPAALLWGWILRRHRPQLRATWAVWRRWSRSDRLPVSIVVSVLLVTAIVAWFTPPQTWDSLNYHMSRVAHWAEQASVRPFATGIENQNSRPPGAEFAVLHLYVLARSDRWANFVEWGAVAGSLLAVLALARQLGAAHDGRRLSVVYAATLPMAIVQASSTMTDAVVALWVAIAAVEVLALPDDGPVGEGPVWASLAAGLALLTKPTAAPFLLPWALWALVRILRRQGWRAAFGAVTIAVVVVAAVNAGAWSRSIQVYGDPISGGDQFDVHANEALGLDGQISNVLRNAALQLGTPSPHVNRVIALAILEAHHLLGISPDDPRTTAHGHFKVDTPTTRENTTSNPAQAYLGLVALAVVFFRRDSSRNLKGLALAALAGFWIFSTVFKWQIFGSRYHLVFFILWAPVAGTVLARLVGARWTRAIAVGLFVLAFPWLLSIRSRPLIPDPRTSLVGSVLTESRPRLLLANGLYLLTPYQEMAGLIEQADCRAVGLALGGNSAEYPLWVFLGFPQTDRHIEWLVAGTPSARLTPSTFAPCAVICEGCGSDDLFRGLPRAYARSGFVLFLGARDG